MRNEPEQDRRQLPKSRGEERSETGLAATALEGKLGIGEKPEIQEKGGRWQTGRCKEKGEAM